MRNDKRSPLNSGWVRWPAALGVVALLLLAGCGGSARNDVDLNAGTAIKGGLTPEEMVELESAFPLMGSGTDEQPQWTYRIGAGDQLEMAFFSHPDQNRFVTVRPDGRITMPYVGDVAAAGKAPEALAAELRLAYAEVLVAPRIDVIVQTMGSRYYVLGEVGRPGEFPYERPVDLMQAIAHAGGYKNTARLTSIVVLRRGEDGDTYAGVFDFRRFLDAETRISNIEVRPDDLIWVPRSAVARWDNAAKQSLSGVLQAEQAVIQGMTIARFDDVYQRVRF
jgi:protein involved in polysaccharide export with SLBB domain